MTRPRTTSPVRRAVRPALAAAVLVAVLAGCTSTPAAPGQSSAVPATSTVSATASAGVTTAPSTSARGTVTGSSPTSSTAGATTPVGSATGDATATTGSPSASTGTAGSSTSASSYSGGTSAVSTVPSSSLPPAATTEVPAPGSGNIDETVPSVAETTAPSRQLTQTAQFGGRVTADIVSLKAITGEANGPGEIAGPALSVTLRITNGSARSIDLTGVGVTLTDSSGGPTSTLVGPPASPFTGTLAAGADATGTYVFTIATDKRRPVTLSLSYSTEAPTVVFSGNAP